MQSGIAASADLQSAFATFTNTPTLFALPITITSESLQPLPPIPSSHDFKSSLLSLTPHLQPKSPIYLLLRRSTDALVAITYIPSTAPVRSKTLFASTRASLVRDLGTEKFSETLFATDAEEILDPRQWEERAGGGAGDGVDSALLSAEERELQHVKRAEEEERHGTSGRDLMGQGGSGAIPGSGTGSSGIRMKVTDEAKAGLARLRDSVAAGAGTGTEGGVLVQLGIEVSSETLTLLSSHEAVSPAGVSSQIPGTSPSYTFYHYPGTEAVVFIYTCPGSSKVKERMVYAASRSSVVQLAKSEGVVVTKRLEGGDPDDISEQRLRDEVGVKDTAGDAQGLSSRQGFARPKRPGRK